MWLDHVLICIFHLIFMAFIFVIYFLSDDFLVALISFLYTYSWLIVLSLQLPSQMGAVLNNSLLLHYINCVRDESVLLRLYHWLSQTLQEGKNWYLEVLDEWRRNKTVYKWVSFKRVPNSRQEEPSYAVIIFPVIMYSEPECCCCCNFKG